MKKSKVLSLLLCNNFEKEFKKFSDKFIIKIDNKKYLDEIFYFIEDEYFLNYELKTDYLWCKYYGFWNFFELKFNFNYEQVKYLIKFMVEEHFKLNKIRPWKINKSYITRVEEHFKLNEITPHTISWNVVNRVEEHFKFL